MSNVYLEKIAEAIKKKPKKKAKPFGIPEVKAKAGFIGVHPYHKHNDSAILARLSSAPKTKKS